MQQYTSPKLSKLLAKNGCELAGSKCWYFCRYAYEKEILELLSPNMAEEVPKCIVPKYFAYDFLWDICVKYAKEFFGESYPKEIWNERIAGDDYSPTYFYQYATNVILSLIEQDKTEAVEDYIWEHCSFNPKNK